MMACNDSLRDRIADELAYNDECGPGPVSRQEYEDDADAILRIVVDALLSDEALTAAARAAEAVAGAYGRPIGAGVARRIARAVLKTAGAVEREDG